MKKKLLSLISIILVGVMMLTGCGGSPAAPTAGSTPEATTTTATDEVKGDGTVVFYVVRHGKTMLNTTDRVQGWSDAVLTPAGEEVITATGKGLNKANINFDYAYSSDSGRSIQTANIILEQMGLQDLHLTTDRRFREFNFGTYEGEFNELMWTDIAESNGKTLEEWMETMTPQNFADSVAKLDKEKMKKDKIEEGINWPAEDYATITARLKDGLTSVGDEIAANGGGNVLLVSHGLSISAMIDVLSEGKEAHKGQLANGSVTTIEYKDGKFTILDVNNVTYQE